MPGMPAGQPGRFDGASFDGAAVPGAPASAGGIAAAGGIAPVGGIAPPTLSLPTGGGAIRGIGEKFGVDPATGSGSLSVPLTTSPGRGLQPGLSLTYDTGHGNGPWGVGWSLSVPAITRKTDKGLPRYDEQDGYLLSGSEDLVPVLDADWRPLEYERVEDGQRYRVRRYRPRVDSAFARIERWTAVDGGEVHWRSVTVDNVANHYGRTAQSRIADPAEPGHVFSWLLCRTTDDRGEAVVYEYRAEDDAGVDLAAVHEQNRTSAGRAANRYLKRIRYGNRISTLVDGSLSRAGWMFEVIFDYGEHDRSTAEVRPWLCRADPFSSYRAGFEVRSYRLCQRVLMFHHFPDQAEVGADCLVRSTDFGYAEDPERGSAPLTTLVSIQQHGYRRLPGGGYRSAAIPAL